DPAEGRERVRRNLAHYGLWDDTFDARVSAVCGDLERDGLGLDAAGRAALADVDAIYHCAARISWLMPYRLLRASNVLGMKRVVELAIALGGPTLNVVSSAGATFVRPFEDEAMVQWTLQQTGLGTESIFELPLGYMETKWVVDRLAERARARGLVVNRYSPGLICGHSETGVDSLSDSQFVYALIKGSAQLGIVPDGRGWRFCPVDVVARDIVRTSLLPGTRNADLCIDSSTVMDPADLVDVLRARDIDVELAPYAAWRQRVLDLADRDDKGNALYAFTDTIFALTPLRFQGQRLQLEWRLQNRGASEEARAALEPRRHLHRTLLERMVDYYLQLGEMPVRPPG
ncbi:MAG TPA: SDR family oxidoreductase, partial [Myxococcota bacterium]|nr:SDR family oxidoreductase [Myxococcota bacterium]